MRQNTCPQEGHIVWDTTALVRGCSEGSWSEGPPRPRASQLLHCHLMVGHMPAGHLGQSSRRSRNQLKNQKSRCPFKHLEEKKKKRCRTSMKYWWFVSKQHQGVLSKSEPACQSRFYQENPRAGRSQSFRGSTGACRAKLASLDTSQLALSRLEREADIKRMLSVGPTCPVSTPHTGRHRNWARVQPPQLQEPRVLDFPDLL
jgi:hypothetical protein